MTLTLARFKPLAILLCVLVSVVLLVQALVNGTKVAHAEIQQACAHHSSTVPETAPDGTVTACKALPTNLLATLQKNADFKVFQQRETLDISRAILAGYKGTSVQLVSIPISDGREDGFKVLWAYYDPTTTTFGKVVVLEIRQGDRKGKSNLHVYKPDGVSLYDAQFEDGKIVSSVINDESLNTSDNEVNPQGEDWACFARCIKSYFDKMPEPIKWICGGACWSCFEAPGPNCWVCALCLGVGGAFCHGFCWD